MAKIPLLTEGEGCVLQWHVIWPEVANHTFRYQTKPYKTKPYLTIPLGDKPNQTIQDQTLPSGLQLWISPTDCLLTHKAFFCQDQLLKH